MAAQPAKSRATAGRKWVYRFGAGKADGNASMKELLGGKGANLAEMSSLSLPVPPGFTITTEVCTAYYTNGRKLPEDLAAEVEAALAEVERTVGAKFGDRQVPLLVSVRSGAPASMPGMMDTVLNLGLNDETVEGIAAKTGNPRFAYDSYRRFIQMYSNVVLGVDGEVFEDILDHTKSLNGFTLDTELTAEHWRQVIASYKKAVEGETDKPFPQDTAEQLWGAIAAVFGSWQNARAATYRRLHDIPVHWGTAVNVQAMVFGNRGDTSATGVAFTRNPSTGANEIYGEFLVNAQGEDVVAGIRTPQSLTEAARLLAKDKKPSLETLMPKAFGELREVFDRLEGHYRDMQDIEFTIQEGKLFILQTRSGKRTTKAALKIAVDLAEQGLISQAEAVSRIDPMALDQLLHPTLDPDAKKEIIASGLPASPGAAVGEVVFTADEAEEAKAKGRDVLLVRVETSSRGHPRHACGCGHPDHARRHDEPCGGGGARHGAAVRLGRRRHPYRLCQGHDDCRQDHREKRRCAHHRRLDRTSTAWPRGDAPARAIGRLRETHDLGRQPPPHEGPRQCRDAARRDPSTPVRRGGHRPLPHRAHVFRRGPHPRHARDDLLGDGAGPPSRAGKNPADAASGLRRAVRDHGGLSRDHPPARSAAARVSAARGAGNRGSRQGAGRHGREAEGARR